MFVVFLFIQAKTHRLLKEVCKKTHSVLILVRPTHASMFVGFFFQSIFILCQRNEQIVFSVIFSVLIDKFS